MALNLTEHFDAFKTRLLAAKNVLITTHYNPDGDAIGSSLALKHLLGLLGIRSNVFVPSPFPDFLKWMKGSEKIVIYTYDPGKSRKILNSCDFIFSIDYNSPERLKELTSDFKQSTATKVLIDHHPQPAEGFDFALSRIEVSSTAELVYELIGLFQLQELIDKDIAACLYAGIMTDTGSFSYSCNYISTFLATAALIKTGIDISRINQLVYDTYSENRLRLLGFCLSEKLVVLKEFSTAYISIADYELKRFQFKPGDTEGIVNYALSIQGIVLAVLFTERENAIRISFRSRGEFCVNTFARRHYRGGGHKNAAGADSYKTMDETITEFVCILADYRHELQSEAEKLVRLSY